MKNNLKIITNEIFNITLITYLIFILVESFRDGFISMYFNINILLGVIMATGIILVFIGGGKDQNENTSSLSRNEDWFIPACLAIITGVLVYFKIQTIGTLSIFVAIIAAVISFYLSYYIQS